MDDTTTPRPVKISGGAHASLSYLARTWSGWGNKATLVLGTPDHSPYAECLHDPHFRITVNPETLLLNPNRVLNTVTPFRLRQEALVTGALLHEAGHARHSHWQPGRYGNPVQAVHGDGTPVTPLVLEFAKVIEEARIEGLIAAEADTIGAKGLAWTMRCSAIKVLPFTEVNVDPDQAMLDVLCSWVLRAGRQISTQIRLSGAGVTYVLPGWVSEFNTLLSTVANKHIIANKIAAGANPFDEPSAEPEMTDVMSALLIAVTAGVDADQPGSTTQVDTAKRILDLLFPAETQDDLDTQGGCPEDAAAEDESGDESDEQDSGEGEADDTDDEPGDDGSEGDSDDEADADDTGGTSDEDGSEGEGDTEPEDEGSGTEPGAGDSASDEAEPSEADLQAQADLQAELEAIEQDVSKQAEQEKTSEIANPSETGESSQEADQSGDPSGASGGRGEGQRNLHYRSPDSGEREVKKGATSFLRNIIDPSEAGKMQITDSPSASVDGAALAAWKAGGQKSDPRFFRRVKRTDTPAPPVKIAILVDVSASMDVLQAPSALLSWALSSACLDLRNFAGRGVQVESCLIHWGSSARVIQANGQPMEGIHEGDCNESTVAMDSALDLVAEQMPGFFDAPTKNENRLLVQFTDWELSAYHGSLEGVVQRIDTALTNGVNMLSVVPSDYSWRRTKLDDVTRGIRNPVGRNSLLRYNPDQPGEVWTAATEVLSGTANNYGF